MIEEEHRITCPIYLWQRGETKIFFTQSSITGDNIQRPTPEIRHSPNKEVKPFFFNLEEPLILFLFPQLAALLQSSMPTSTDDSLRVCNEDFCMLEPMFNPPSRVRVPERFGDFFSYLKQIVGLCRCHISIVWITLNCNLVGGYRHSGEKCCLLIRTYIFSYEVAGFENPKENIRIFSDVGLRFKWAWSSHANVSSAFFSYFFVCSADLVHNTHRYKILLLLPVVR
jgi:hypothetical protein